MTCLRSAKFPFHFLDIGIEVGVMGSVIGRGPTPYMRQSFNSPHVLKVRKRSRRMLKKATFTRAFPIPNSFFKSGLVDPRLRASNEHILIVRVPRAGGRLGYPRPLFQHPAEFTRDRPYAKTSIRLRMPRRHTVRQVF